MAKQSSRELTTESDRLEAEAALLKLAECVAGDAPGMSALRVVAGFLAARAAQGGIAEAERAFLDAGYRLAARQEKWAGLDLLSDAETQRLGNEAASRWYALLALRAALPDAGPKPTPEAVVEAKE